MKAANRNWNPGRPQRTRQIECARILIGLHADKRHQAEIAVTLKSLYQFLNFDSLAEFVDCFEVDINVRTEHLALDAFERNAVDRGQRVRGDNRTPPADHVAIFAVMRRLNENELKSTIGGWFRQISVSRLQQRAYPPTKPI